MKKFIVSLLALVYLAATAGATVTMHFCMGDLTGWSLSQSTADHCTVCGMKKTATSKNGCCKDEHTKVKLQQEQAASAFNFLCSPATAMVASPVYLPELTEHLLSVSEEYPLANAPPRSSYLPVYLSNRNFRL